MKPVFLAVGAAALMALATLSAPAQAQPYRDRPQVIVVQPPPPPHHGPRYDHRYDHRRDHRQDRRAHRRLRDHDRDGVPNRYDRFPNNPYRR
jgi:hypothetical protein